MNNKKNLVFMVIGAITLIAVTLGATYAYFTAQSGGSGNIDTDVITGTTDNLSFSFGDMINIYATEENFAQGMGSISDSTTGQAILKANNTTNEATARYNIYLIIENNDFVYTTEEGTPEIVLNVTDPNGNKVENITGLVHYENGFDITTRTGGFLLVPDYEISATDTQTVQDWNIEVTLVNLDSDQNANTGKSLTGKLYITQDQMSSYELTEINDIDATTTYNSIDATLDLTNGSAEVSKYYYGIEKTNEIVAYQTSGIKKLSNTLASAEDVEYIESDTPNYEFTNLEPETEYTIYSYVEDENKIKSNVYETNITTAEYKIPTVDTVNHSVTLNSISLTVNATPGSNEIVKYMYSKDNGNSWEESTSNTYTFTDLTDSTEYKIKVKVVDSEGVESTEYYEAITTEIYILPVVASVNATTTWNSITLTPSGTNGTNTISKYMYSINNGAYQESNVFNNLTDNQTYTIKVKAIDCIGRESNIYEMQVKTDEYQLPVISNVTTTSTKDNITINVAATPGDGSIVSYHYSKDDGSNYSTTSNSSYTFSGLTAGTTYYIKVYITDSNGRTSSVYSSVVATQNPTYFADYIKGTYNGGTNGLYLHNSSLANSAQDGSYRYAGANPNNYVCFGSNAASCPTNNLYRIIGVFGNQVKLIKNTSLGNYEWDSDNIWSTSFMNNTLLNGSYLSSLGTTWSNKIATTSWRVGPVSNRYIYYEPPIAYQYEIGSSSTVQTSSEKIGLMYISDYGYAASPSYWTTGMSDYNTVSANWMKLGANEWSISRHGTMTMIFVVDNTGKVMGHSPDSYTNAARPVFYLQSTVTYVSGTGTSSNPYRID